MTTHLDNHLFGKRVEKLFEKECRRRRIPVFSPMTDCTACDRIVRVGNGVLTVQVKGVRTAQRWKRRPGQFASRYVADNHRRNGSRYTFSHVDVIAFYVEPLKRWHILAAAGYTGKRIRISANPTGPMLQSVENWALLGA